MDVLKNAALQKYYDDLFAMFASPGWAAFVEDRKAEADARSNLRNVKRESHDFVKGQLDVLDFVIAAKDVTETAYAELLRQQTGEGE